MSNSIVRKSSSSDVASPTLATYRSDDPTASLPLESLVKIHFEKQPPSNLRKSNFFHFVLSFHDCNQRLVEVEMAKFIEFIEDVKGNTVISNGASYKLRLRFDSGLKVEKELCIRLVDSATKELIKYEGQEKNNELRRVLLTHEIMCTRCSEKKSCGNRNETPSDPVIVDKYFIKVFLKCNQNCLRNAGNPRESRRFQLAICPSSKSVDDVMSYSENIFVHNNSKYGRQPKKQGSTENETPRIRALCPEEGWITGYTSVIIIGDNFYEGLQVAFGNVYVWSELISPHALKVQTPPMQSPGTVDVTLSFKSRQYCRNKPGKFSYTAVEPTLELRFQRLAQMIPGYSGEADRLAKDVIAKLASEISEVMHSIQQKYPIPFPNGSLQQTPTGLPVGMPLASPTTFGYTPTSIISQCVPSTPKMQESDGFRIQSNFDSSGHHDVSSEVSSAFCFPVNGYSDNNNVFTSAYYGSAGSVMPTSNQSKEFGQYQGFSVGCDSVGYVPSLNSEFQLQNAIRSDNTNFLTFSQPNQNNKIQLQNPPEGKQTLNATVNQGPSKPKKRKSNRK